MFEAVGSELVVAAVIGLFSFIGSMLAVKVELRFINKEVERIAEESKGNNDLMQKGRLDMEKMNSRIFFIESKIKVLEKRLQVLEEIG